MKLVTFQHQDVLRVGVAIAGGIVDLARRVPELPNDMIRLIAAWPEVRGQVERAIADGRPDFASSEVRLCAPIPRPGKLLGTGLNYADHAKEAGLEAPAAAIWFAMPATAVTGPFEPIQLPRVSEQLDYEVELVFVIGRRCRHVPRYRAREVIFGFCVGNDVSVRDWQMRTSQVVIGKSFDTHAPFGPCIVTADELGDPHSLGIRCFVNGEKRQDSNTRELIHDCYAQVEDLSKAMTLEPGDVIFTGTPAGVGLGFRPPRWLKAGDVVRAEIDGIGHIVNTVVPEPDEQPF